LRVFDTISLLSAMEIASYLSGIISEMDHVVSHFDGFRNTRKRSAKY